jgi:hypothetical protein
MKAATLALVVRSNGDSLELVEILSDDREIGLLASGVESQDPDPLKPVYDYRLKQIREEEEFGNYIEELLSQPFLRPDIQDHGVQWLKSRIRIEKYQKNESEAANIIAKYACQVFKENPSSTDFLMEGHTTRVRVRVFVMGSAEEVPNARRAA